VVDRFGIGVSLVNTVGDLATVEKAITPRTKMLWIETPGNPLLSIADIRACAAIAQRHKILLAVDNTFATPALTRPLELGADIVMHSATKYIGGHSDVLGGALAVKDKELYDRLYFVQNATGAIMGPLESYLCSRGLKTLELRIREQSRVAAQLADWLAGHKHVAAVRYPGRPEHPGHEIAQRQMDRVFGAMLSFEITGDYAAAKRTVESTRLIQLAVSLGAVESLIEQPASMSHASYQREDRLAHGISDGLIRLSVGLEAFEDLRDDLDQALAKAH
jgi:cystathionine gamma-lyase